MKDRLLSVVIPSYNYAGFLPQAVKSVAAQTYPEIELVIVDDCSQDDSCAVIRALEQRYRGAFSGGIRVILNDVNMGAHAAINRGIAEAQGEWAAVLNADDLYEKDRFAVMMKQAGGARFAFSAVRCIGAAGEPLLTEQALAFQAIQDQIAGKRSVALAAVAENITISTGNMVFEKKLFWELGGFQNYQYVHDYDFFLRACLVTEPVFVGGTAYLYRLHGNNSFTRLQKEGRVENRVVWLAFYAAVKQGRVQNEVILENPAYKKEFYAAVCREGNKKKTLWKWAGTPLARSGIRLLKKMQGL